MGVDQKSGRVYTIHIINAFSKVTTDHYKFLMLPCLCIIEREIAINHQVIIPRQPKSVLSVFPVRDYFLFLSCN